MAIVNPGTGLASGFYVAVGVVLYAVFRYGFQARLALIDWLAVNIACLLLASPLWALDPALTGSASRGCATAVLYFVAIRLVIRTRVDFDYFGLLIALMCLVYACYFLNNAIVKDRQTFRLSVEFANSNYTGAILAFGLVVTLWRAFVCSTRPGPRILWALACILESWALFETGSRASAAGPAAAVIVLVFLQGRWITVRNVTLAILVAGFLMGFFPQAANLFRSVSDPVSNFETFNRGDRSVLNLSGREEIWSSARSLISEEWVLGLGPESYRLALPSYTLVHSWGLEYMASVGIVGTSAVALLIWLAFTGRRFRGMQPPSRDVWLWNSITALSLVPNLVLSTHQWTLWAWAGFALFTRSGAEAARE